jgi:hypothetical protein
MSPVVWRFSAAGNDDLATRSGGRRPKTCTKKDSHPLSEAALQFTGVRNSLLISFPLGEA